MSENWWRKAPRPWLLGPGGKGSFFEDRSAERSGEGPKVSASPAGGGRVKSAGSGSPAGASRWGAQLARMEAAHEERRQRWKEETRVRLKNPYANPRLKNTLLE